MNPCQRGFTLEHFLPPVSSVGRGARPSTSFVPLGVGSPAVWLGFPQCQENCLFLSEHSLSLPLRRRAPKEPGAGPRLGFFDGQRSNRSCLRRGRSSSTKAGAEYLKKTCPIALAPITQWNGTITPCGHVFQRVQLPNLLLCERGTRGAQNSRDVTWCVTQELWSAFGTAAAKREAV